MQIGSLRIRLAETGRIAGTGNMPGGEFFGCPVESSAEGTIAFTEFPAVWQGRDILKRLTAHPGSISKGNIRSLLAMAYHAATLPPLSAQLHRLEQVPGNGT